MGEGKQSSPVCSLCEEGVRALPRMRVNYTVLWMQLHGTFSQSLRTGPNSGPCGT